MGIVTRSYSRLLRLSAASAVMHGCDGGRTCSVSVGATAVDPTLTARGETPPKAGPDAWSDLHRRLAGLGHHAAAADARQPRADRDPARDGLHARLRRDAVHPVQVDRAALGAAARLEPGRPRREAARVLRRRLHALCARARQGPLG